MALTVVAAAGCDASRDPVLGTGGAVRAPTVTAVTPSANAVDVGYADPVINATFSETVSPIGGNSSFTLSCAAPCVNPTGTVALDAGNTLATYTLSAGTELAPLTLYTATVTGATSATTGLPMDEPFVWQFTTSAAPVVPPPTPTPPTVTAVTPPANAVAVGYADPVINASFSEAVSPIGGSSSFTVSCAAPCTSPTGAVALDASGRVATYTLATGTALAPLTLYTATVTGATSATTGLAMAAPFVWQFTTAAGPVIPPPTPPAPSVTTVTPSDNATGVDYDDTVINARFSETVAPIGGSSSFTVSCAAPCASPTGTVALDASKRVATYTLTAGTALAPLTQYTATVTGATSATTGVAMAAPFVWHFTTGIAPTVTAVAPADNATGVAYDNTLINAEFSEPVSPIGGSSSFTVTCAAPCTDPVGTVTMNAGNTIATYTLAAGSLLTPQTLYTAAVSGATSIATGLDMDAPFVWQFTTGIVPDTTRPRVSTTQPLTTTPGPTPNVPVNTAVTAVFSEDMNPATISGASFTLACAAPCVSPLGSVSYTVGSRTAKFTPTSALAPATTYTATVTTGARDLAGNALAGNQAPLPASSDYLWSFTTAAAPIPPQNVSVLSTSPAAGATGVCPSAAINVRFKVPSGLRMDPASISSGTILLTGPAPGFTPVVASSVVLDAATGRVATFTPQVALGENLVYTARVRGGASGVKDLAVPANTMVSDFSWSFTTGPATGACLAPVPLGSAAPFGVFGGSAGMTNSGLQSIVNGDIGTTAVSTAVTGFHDAGPGCTYTETPLNIGIVNGLIYTAAPPPTVACPTEGTAVTFGVASQARADALIAYNDLAAVPSGSDPGAGSLANLVLAPGVYTSAAGSFTIQGGDLTLDANGDANAVWIFQMATSLTIGGPGASFPQSIVLINGAQAKNVFWQVGSAATLNAAGGGTIAGTMITQTGVAVSTAGNTDIVTVNGRLLSLGASVTVVDTVINVPAP